ncbi:hypothetical protein BDV12DRAFT_163423 [Aspergillus spectabilis]
MSTLNSGRQSPPPEDQTGAQENSPPASGRTDSKFAPPPEYAPSGAKAQGHSGTEGLTSNPHHKLEEIEAGKYKKGTGN